MSDVDHKSTGEGMYKIKTEELISKSEELKQSSDTLLDSNNALQLKTEELAKTNEALFESNHELASVNKELAATNIRFAETNKRFSEVNKQLSASIEELAIFNYKFALATEQIKAREKMLVDFINIAAHELRTPTQSILGYSELLQLLSEDDDKKDDQKKKALEAIGRNANRLDKLAKDILDVARIDSNILVLNKERFNLNKKISDVISDTTTNQIENTSNSNNNNSNKNIEIIFESKGAKDIFVEADKVRIYQVISNLLRNAVKFTKEGTISITANVNTNTDKGGGGELVVVKIKDTGTGIAADILPRLFSKFTTGSSEGVGLGLFISKSIVEAHGGRIWAENNNNGNVGCVKGATFAFSLPLAK